MWNVSTMEQQCMCTKWCYLIQSNLHMWPPLVKRHPPNPNAKIFPVKALPTVQVRGAFHYAKISGNFGPNVNGTVRPRWKFPVKVVHLQRWSSLTGRSGPVWPKIAVPFSQIFVSSPAPAGHHSQNGEWFRCKCSVCKPQMQDLNFFLMHSCTQGSGTATHLNLFFLLVFISF